MVGCRAALPNARAAHAATALRPGLPPSLPQPRALALVAQVRTMGSRMQTTGVLLTNEEKSVVATTMRTSATELERGVPSTFVTNEVRWEVLALAAGPTCAAAIAPAHPSPTHLCHEPVHAAGGCDALRYDEHYGDGDEPCA